MSSGPFKFPETVPIMEPELLVQAFHFAIESVLGEKGLSSEVIRASIDWRPDKTPLEKGLDYGADFSNAFVEFFSGNAMLVYTAIVRTFSMLTLIDEGGINKELLTQDDIGQIVIPDKILRIAAQVPLEAKQGFEAQTFLSALKSIDE